MTTYVTFGQDHVHSISGVTFDKDCVAEIPSISPSQGRERAFEIFGRKFCFEYFNEPPDMQFFPRGIIKVPGS